MKYRLIKWYPSLPKDWEVGTIITHSERWSDLRPLDKSSATRYIEISEAHNYPEYWEKVEEKSYEILSYTYPALKALATKRSNGLFINDEDTSKLGVYAEPLESHWIINSIKRLSDGEIFTLGDSIHRNGKVVTLEKIELDKGWAGGVKFNDGIKPHGGECITGLRKADKLFTTIDGVDIHIGDTFYYVNDKWGMYDYTVNQCSSFLPSVYKTSFSTREKAEEWVLWNKPCISLNDVYQTTLSSCYADILDNLKEIAKSRL